MRQQVTMTLGDEPRVIDLAAHAFSACVDARLNPSLICERVPYDGEPDHAEYNVTLGGRGSVGVLHEDFAALLIIANDHGARLFLDRDGVLALVWPRDDPLGPGDPADRGLDEIEKDASRGRKPKAKR